MSRCIIFEPGQDFIAQKMSKIIDAKVQKCINNISSKDISQSKILVYFPNGSSQTYKTILDIINRIGKLPPIIFISTDDSLSRDLQLGLIEHFVNSTYGGNTAHFKLPNDLEALQSTLERLEKCIEEKDLAIKLLECLNDVKGKFKFSTIEQAYIEINSRIFDKERLRSRIEHDLWNALSAGSMQKKLLLPKQREQCVNVNWVNFLYDLEREEILQDYSELISSIPTKICQTELNILIIENNPAPIKNDLIQISRLTKWKYYIRSTRIKELYEKLMMGETEINTLVDFGKENNNAHELRDFDMILLDLNLGAGLRGEVFLKLFYRIAPHIPVFILSSSEDINIVRKAFMDRADGYIPKARIISLPKMIQQYYRELGELIWLGSADDKIRGELRRNLLGNIRKWRFRRDLLWFGDKCYHMINHSFNHSANDWSIANQILPPILRYLEQQGEGISSDEIYAFCMAVWLHDIGHRGNSRYGEPHDIRDYHGLISGELVLNNPGHYGVFGYEKDKRSKYHNIAFGKAKTAPQAIRDEIKIVDTILELALTGKEVTNLQQWGLLERIALISIYHKSNFPISANDVENILMKKKYLPSDCYDNLDRNNKPIDLVQVAELLRDSKLPHLIALFRFIDGIDINKNRVGSSAEKDIKITTIDLDLKYQLSKLKDEVQKLSESDPLKIGKKARFVDLFYNRVESDLLRKQGIDENLEHDQEHFLDTLDDQIDLGYYLRLRDYIRFIAVQKGHFDLHNAIDEIIIRQENKDRTNEKPTFMITYITTKSRDYVLAKGQHGNVLVKEWRDLKARCIRDHLLGGWDDEGRAEEGYVRRELNNSKEFLNEWMNLEKTTVKIVNPHEGWEEIESDVKKL